MAEYTEGISLCFGSDKATLYSMCMIRGACLCVAGNLIGTLALSSNTKKYFLGPSMLARYSNALFVVVQK